MCKNLYLALLVLFITHVSGVEKSQNDTFQATKDWQPIKEGLLTNKFKLQQESNWNPILITGMKVPAGLHYRINLETGVKEAKLLDADDNTDYLQEKKGDKFPSSLSTIKSMDDSNQTQQSNKTSSPSATAAAAAANIEEALKNIPAEIYEYSKDEMDEIKSKFRTYDEIKDQLKDVNLNVRTDAEIMKKLLAEYEELIVDLAKKQPELERILDDLEYLVHQVDNALEFLSQSGLEKVLLPNLNRTNHSTLKVKSLTLLGSALQNNPKAQLSAYEKGLAEHLIRFLSTTKVETEINGALFAFGSLVRHFPLAQRHVLSRSVINVLFGIWRREVHLKIKVKVLTFLTDLLLEGEEARKEAELAGELATRVVEKWRLYEAVNLEQLLKEFEFCRNVEQLVVLEKPALISNPEQTERTVSALNYATRLCRESWSVEPNLRHVLLVLKNRYGDQVKEGGDGEGVEHLREVLGEIERLHDVLFQYLKEQVAKEEL